ncbi:MAG: adenosylmethionine decarboxylase [Myxococcales bacterium]|nr:adenosylmethionine decarboxylase [Myxococcales bacterium]
MHFFEGPEKKVEIVVAPRLRPLRALERSVWERVVVRARAQILSVVSSSGCDAYLLSESSLFVFDDRVTMLTCGTTTLVEAARELLSFLPVGDVELFVYERKNEYFPQHQVSDFFEDAKALNRLIPGRAVQFGDADEHVVSIFHGRHDYRPAADDVTLEVLMHNLDDDAAALFCAGDATRVEGLAVRTGADRILPGYTVDEFVFEPAGYSLNAVRDDRYYTIHVTPEQVGSYVSFETNHPVGDALVSVVERVLAIFRPRSFDVVTFSPQPLGALEVPGYRVRDRVRDRLCGFEVAFTHLYRPPTTARPPQELELPPAE